MAGAEWYDKEEAGNEVRDGVGDCLGSGVVNEQNGDLDELERWLEVQWLVHVLLSVVGCFAEL